MRTKSANAVGGLPAGKVQTYPCPIFGGNAVPQSSCQAQSCIIPKNQAVCAQNSCASPWRFCLFCLKQGHKKYDAVVVDPAVGLCVFHKQNGHEAVRKTNGEVIYTPADVAKAQEALKLVKRRAEKAVDRELSSNVDSFVDENRRKADTADLTVTPAHAPNTKVISDVILIKRSRIRRFAQQPREFFNKVSLENLAESIRIVGQKQPILVKRIKDDPAHDYELVDGERRWLACGLIDPDYPMSAVTKVVDSVDDQYAVAAITNFGREDHQPLETARAIDKLMKVKSWSLTEVAKVLSRPLVWVSRHHRLLKLHPDVMKLMSPELPESKRLTMSLALELTEFGQTLQKQLALEIVRNGMKANMARIMIRAKASEGGAPSRKKREPRRDFWFIRRQLQKVRESADIILLLDLTSIFRSRPWDDVGKTVTEIDEDIDRFQRIRRTLSELK